MSCPIYLTKTSKFIMKGVDTSKQYVKGEHQTKVFGYYNVAEVHTLCRKVKCELFVPFWFIHLHFLPNPLQASSEDHRL